LIDMISIFRRSCHSNRGWRIQKSQFWKIQNIEDSISKRWYLSWL